MDYRQATALFERGPCHRKLANKTYAYLTQDAAGGYVDIELFSKRIIRFYPSGVIEIDNHNYWQGPTTKDRLNRFLPGRANIQTYWVRKDRRVWLIADRPYSNGLYSTDLKLQDYPLMNMRSGRAMIQKLQAYANDFSHALVRGEIPWEATRCNMCRSWNEHPIPQQRETHLLWHIDSGYFSSSLLEQAIGHSPDGHRCNSLHRAWKEYVPLWRRPKNNKERIEQLEQRIREHVQGVVDHPRSARVLGREVLEDFLLKGIGFDLWNKDSSN